MMLGCSDMMIENEFDEILILKMKMRMGENMNDKMMATRNGKMKNEDEWEYDWTTV